MCACAACRELQAWALGMATLAHDDVILMKWLYVPKGKRSLGKQDKGKPKSG